MPKFEMNFEFENDIEMMVIQKAILMRIKHLKGVPSDRELDHYKNEVEILDRFNRSLQDHRI